jgi:anaerobic sulfite reductase subunit B
MNPFTPRAIQIIGIKEESPDIKTFILDEVMYADPDQFLQVSIPGIGECPISISSSSGEAIELTIRKVGRVTKEIHHATVGSCLFVRGPYGHGIPVKELEGKNINIIGGGSGIAPLRGLIRYINNNRKNFGDLRLFFGFRTPRDILFEHEIEDWKDKFATFVTVDTADEAWRGEIGLITKLIRDKRVVKENAVVVLCGPPTMMGLVASLLNEEFGIEDRQMWISLERYMKCGIGKCGHCRIDAKYVCQDGPVLNYEVAKKLID